MTLHKPVRHRFKRNKVIVGAVDEEWEADLVMDSLSKENNGYDYDYDYDYDYMTIYDYV